MKTYHMYQNESKQAEMKLRNVEGQKQKVEQQLSGKNTTSRKLKVSRILSHSEDCDVKLYKHSITILVWDEQGISTFYNHDNCNDNDKNNESLSSSIFQLVISNAFTRSSRPLLKC